jgi:two-component system nitrogen regulation sensor histidine kinase NtrY
LRPVAARQAVDAVAADLSTQIRTRTDGEAAIVADPFLLNQVLLNLWKNAFEAGATEVRVTIDDSHPVVSITIADNGPGLPPDQAERVWLPYVTLKKGGTGLGLPVVKRLVGHMGGEVSLTTRTEGPQHGVTVTIELPAVSTDESETDAGTGS